MAEPGHLYSQETRPVDIFQVLITLVHYFSSPTCTQHFWCGFSSPLRAPSVGTALSSLQTQEPQRDQLLKEEELWLYVSVKVTLNCTGVPHIRVAEERLEQFITLLRPNKKNKIMPYSWFLVFSSLLCQAQLSCRCTGENNIPPQSLSPLPHGACKYLVFGPFHSPRIPWPPR